jgi:hypothetical protein
MQMRKIVQRAPDNAPIGMSPKRTTYALTISVGTYFMMASMNC